MCFIYERRKEIKNTNMGKVSIISQLNTRFLTFTLLPGVILTLPLFLLKSLGCWIQSGKGGGEQLQAVISFPRFLLGRV